jgi:hypothetical protein
MKFNLQFKDKESLKRKALKSGWIPGTEIIILKTVIKIGIAIYVGYTLINMIEEVSGYQEIAAQNVNAIKAELSINKMQLPPLETLTDILDGAKRLPVEEKVTYFLEHKRALLNIMKDNQELTVEEVSNLNEIITYISKEANKANDIATKEAAQDFLDSIKETNNNLRNKKYGQ